MDEDEFWQLLADACEVANAPTEVNQRIRRRHSAARLLLLRLEKMLSLLSEPELLEFHRTLVRIHRRAYRRDVWTAFDLALGGVEMIQFAEAISWLVLQGRSSYDEVLADPDALATLPIDEEDLRDADGIDSIATAVVEPDPNDLLDDELADEYRDKVREIEEEFELVVYFDPPPGDPLPGDLDSLRQRFPKLTDRQVPRTFTELPRPLPSLVEPRGRENRLPGPTTG
ncbi:MAG: DUF4240 domain-containing protein [Sciscionella sp.]